MPGISIYLPLNRSRGLLLRLVARIARPPTRRAGAPPRGHAVLPAHLRQDVGLPPIEEPPPVPLPQWRL
ncbi:hypothetical protein [uncultured Roseobacter sp.]|uniref:hypothetical protein n=1 Tax=uncultured Roseobacter sp. TaxID=114847 RepID=UPI002610F466|nr:hypothetical protein [uncultured Roseobacter sp.]